MSSIRFQVNADGYAAPEWSDGQTVIPVVDQNGRTRVTVDLGGEAVSGANPLPVDIGSVSVTISGTQTVQGTAAAGAAASGNPVQAGGVYNTSAPTPSNGQMEPLQVDASANLKCAEQFAPQAEDNTNGVIAVQFKPLATSTYNASLYTYFAGAITKDNIKNATGNVYSFTVTNRNGAVRYLGLHNKATAPTAGEAPLVVFMIPAGSTLSIGADWFGHGGINFSTGIGWAIGTTVATFTDSATASEHEVQVRYF